jgi:hypothetical protein
MENRKGLKNNPVWEICVRDCSGILASAAKQDKAESPAPSQGSGQAKGQRPRTDCRRQKAGFSRKKE